MKLTRRQLRKIISEVTKGYLPPEYDDGYFDMIRGAQSSADMSAAQKIFNKSPEQGLELGAIIPEDPEAETQDLFLDLSRLGFKEINQLSIRNRYTNFNEMLEHIAEKMSEVSGKNVKPQDLIALNLSDWQGESTYFDLKQDFIESAVMARKRSVRDKFTGWLVDDNMYGNKRAPLSTYAWGGLEHHPYAFPESNGKIIDHFIGMPFGEIWDMLPEGPRVLFVMNPTTNVFRGELKRK